MYKGKYLAEEQPKKEKKPRTKGTKIFYYSYGAFVLCLLIAIGCLMIPLYNWLQKYEASQPEQKSAQVFSQLFDSPDWASLYTQAGMQDTVFENKEAFASYMTQKVGDTKLNCMKTSAGLSGDRKYIVRLGEEKIASFTLTDTTGGTSDIAQWELSKVELFAAGSNTVTVQKLPEQTVYINGVALDESYTVAKLSAAAQDYLPQGVYGLRLEHQQVTGLMMPPQVEVKDADGSTVPVIVDENGVHCAQMPAMEISESEKEIAIGAAKANALFSIRAISTYDLQRYFDKNAQIYKDICATDVFMQDYIRYAFEESATVVSDYYRYSDSLFSVNVSLEFLVTRTNGTVKPLTPSTTYFFTKMASGDYRVTNITNKPVQQLQQQVRLTYMIDGRENTQFVAANATSLTLPAVTPPQGQVLKGWATQTIDAAGRNVMTIIFTPTQDNVVVLSADKPLVPMVLHPVFEKADS